MFGKKMIDALMGEPQTLKVVAWRTCACGGRDYQPLNSQDAVFCRDCGQMYMLHVRNPVAEIVATPVDNSKPTQL